MYEKLKRLRKAKGLTLEQVAVAIGVTVGAVAGWENGRWKMTVDNLIKIAPVLGVTVGQLIDEEEGTAA